MGTMHRLGASQGPVAAGTSGGWDLTPAASPVRRRSRATGRVTERQALGAYGERLASRHLMAAGMELLDRNWTAPPGECVSGEVDLVLREDDLLVVCEVKTRRSVWSGTPHEAVDFARVARLRALGEAWLRAHPGVPDPEIRVDLVAVLRPRRGPSTLDHVRGIG